MEQKELNNEVVSDVNRVIPETVIPGGEISKPAPASIQEPVQNSVSSETGTPGCPSCGTAETNDSGAARYVYALGRIEPRFPNLSVEKEFMQVAAQYGVDGLTDREKLYKVLSQRENRYLVRQLCWVFSVEGLETYILVPGDPSDYDLLVDTLRTSPRPTDVDVVIGSQGPIAPPELCSGLMVPIVMFTQIYSFDVDSLIKSIPRPKDIPAKEFSKAAEELFMRIMLMADNAGGTDDHRALNYLAVRYPAIYSTVADAFGRGSRLSSVEVRPSQLSEVYKIYEVIFSFTNTATDVTEKFFSRVNLDGMFPFLVTKMSPYYDR